jgi:hypothetical protein
MSGTITCSNTHFLPGPEMHNKIPAHNIAWKEKNKKIFKLPLNRLQDQALRHAVSSVHNADWQNDHSYPCLGSNESRSLLSCLSTLIDESH